MEYVKFGKSDLMVSRICLGCMSYGDPNSGHHPWVLNEEQSRPHIRRALEAGINFFDTANIYSYGASEEVVGRALKDFAKRKDVVIATKVFMSMDKNDPAAGGLSKAAILREIDNSLKRLGTDHVDLYQIHRWDYKTPIDETMEALHEVVKSGRARYIGASSMHAWQFTKSLYLADLRGWSRFISMQPHYNLLYREEEREMLPLCLAEGIAVMPWSPLARGRLARPWKAGTTAREQSDVFGGKLYAATEAADKEVVGAVEKVAKARGIPQAQVALAWMLQKPAITSPIVGATKESHLDDAVAAVALRLGAPEIAALEAPYIPHAIAGFE